MDSELTLHQDKIFFYHTKSFKYNDKSEKELIFLSYF